MKRRGVLAMTACLLTVSCAVGPNYKRPQVALPDQFRGLQGPMPDEHSLAEVKWAELFQDDALRQLITGALDQNFDLRIASERVLQARAQLGVQRASLFPFFNGQLGWNATRASTLGSLPFISENTTLKYAYTQAGFGSAWELDFWGRIRRLTEAARAQYFASEENRRAAIVSLVAEVASAYFTLLEQDSELAISRQTRDIAVNGLRLTQLRRDRGAASGLDVRQAEQLLYLATAQIAAVQRAIGQTEDSLSFLLGRTPGGIIRTTDLETVVFPAQVSSGLPASLLARRPDIRSAEQSLIAANAQIGAARALYFPQINLTASLGGQSRALQEIFTNPARYATVAPTGIFPIFQAGQIRNTVRLTEAEQREALVAYQRTIYSALREVSDSLIGFERTTEQLRQQEQYVRALNDSVRLSQLRYEGGLDSFLQVLDAQRNLFQGQLILSQLRLLELQSVVGLYRSLGGGWQ